MIGRERLDREEMYMREGGRERYKRGGERRGREEREKVDLEKMT
jgi:hypothetical protein